MTTHDHVIHGNFVNMIKLFKITHVALHVIQGIIFDLPTHLWPFQIGQPMKTKVRNLTLTSIYHRIINCKHLWNTPLDTLIYPLQINNDIQPLSLTLHAISRHLIHQLCNVKKWLNQHFIEYWLEIRITIQFTGELRDVSDLSTLQSCVNFNELRYLINNIEDCVILFLK